MNERANRFLLAGDKFMPEMLFKTARIYMYCLWTIYKKRRKNTKIQTGYQNQLDKPSFQHVTWLMEILKI